MTELSRLLDSSEDELERALLGSVLGESPSEASLRDAALALGLTAATATALVATLPAAASSLGAGTHVATPLVASGAAAAPTLAAPTLAATAGTASLVTLGKGLVGGALVSFFALTTVDHTVATEPSAPAQVAVTASRSRLAPPPTPAATVEKAFPTPEPPASPSAIVVAPGTRRAASKPPSVVAPATPSNDAPARATFETVVPLPAPQVVAPSAASLAAETRLLDRARAALAQGDTGTAGQLLQHYQAGAPSGVLAREAALLRVRLLLATGQRAAASEQARRIISLYPQDAHAESLRSLAAKP